MSSLSVAVVGAGPAGATAARLLAGHGARVSLLEARQMPRRKVCGGGLTPKAQRLLPASALTTVERRIHQVEIRGGRLPAVRLDEPGAEIAMVQRASFDLAMAEAAAEAGVEVRDDERVTTVIEDEDGVTLKTRRGRMRVDVVVAADGDPSSVARQVGLDGPARQRSLALNVDLPLADSAPADSAILSFTIPGGYAWYFPKGDHASVGVGSCQVTVRGGAAGSPLRQSLRRFVAGMGLDVEDGRISGHWVPQGLRQERLATRRVIVAGDAAAAVDPLLGEGIAYAVTSGVVASEVIADMAVGTAADLRVYDARLRQLLRPPLRRLGIAAAIAQRSATVALLAMHLSPWVRSYAVDVIEGRQIPFALDGRL